MRTPEGNLSASKEDYLETILMLSSEGASVRLVDIAAAHGVSKATVSDTLSKLGAAGYVTYEKYRPVTLTKKGKAVASKTLNKHKLLMRFLTGALGVSEKCAEDVACKMEHSIDSNITLKLALFMERLEEAGQLLSKLGVRDSKARRKK